MIDEQAFLSIPLIFKDICLIYPPSIISIAKLGYKTFAQYSKVLTITQEEIQDNFSKQREEIEKLKQTEMSGEEKEIRDLLISKIEGLFNNCLTPFEYILNNSYNDEQFKKITEAAFKFFTKEKIMFAYEDKKILILNEGNAPKIIDELTFIEMQNYIRRAIGEKEVEPYNPDEDPRIARMKAKARWRDRVKARQEEKNGTTLDFGTLMCGFCCMGSNINPLNIGSMSYVSMKKMLKMGQLKEKYNMDIDTLIGGGDSKKIKPKYYLRNLDDD
jgi:hypothetical protein